MRGVHRSDHAIGHLEEPILQDDYDLDTRIGDIRKQRDILAKRINDLCLMFTETTGVLIGSVEVRWNTSEATKTQEMSVPGVSGRWSEVKPLHGYKTSILIVI